ncbi:MAG: MurR/RpiR family transcriptional regulator [Desulfobacteraceae bacterium]
MNFSEKSFSLAIQAKEKELTPKGRKLARFILENPTKAVFLATRDLADKAGVSEATVVRFVRQIGYSTYSEFKNELRKFIDSELTLLERKEMSIADTGENGLELTVAREIDNLKALLESIDRDEAEKIVSLLCSRSSVYIVGSRLSYHAAYYMGWAMTKIRKDVNILKGSDRTSLDWLTVAREDSVVVIVAISRYPNELIRVGKYAKQLGMKLVVIADSIACPLIQFSHHHLITRPKTIPFYESSSSMLCLIIHLLNEVIKTKGDDVTEHQEKLEKAYRENDILFNLD